MSTAAGGTHANLKETYRAIFESESLIFVGASNNIFKWGFNILHNIVKGGYGGRIYPVNPQGGDWHGIPVYREIAGVPEEVKLAVIVVPREMVLKSVLECAKKGVKAAIVITAGFSETGPEGAALEKELVNVARSAGVRLVGPNTMGIYSGMPHGLHALMAGMKLKAGNVALIAQSGNLGSSISYRFIRRDIGISRLASSGNEGDLTVEDYLEMFESDEETRLICLYVEGVRDGRRFLDAARRISVKKPVLLLKGGTSEQGAVAAMSHTGAIAGNDRVFASMCRQAGIITCATMDEMIDTAGILLTQPPMTGNRVCIVTQGGGWGVIATDACAASGLEVSPLAEDVVRELDTVLPAYWSRRNPVDLVAPNRVTTLTDTVEIVLKKTDVNAVLVLGLGYMTLRAKSWLRSSIATQADVAGHADMVVKGEKELFRLMADMKHRYDKPIVPVADIVAFDYKSEDNPVQSMASLGLFAFASPETAVRALANAAEYHRRRLAR